MALFYPQAPIFRPPVPFTTPIHGGLQDGMMVVISGNVINTCERFSVNLQCGPHSPPHDIAFHFNPRFMEGGYVVCNTKENNTWGKEERKYEMPFKKGHFEIRILLKNCSFMVAVNGKHFLEYQYRIPLARVNTLAVEGNVTLLCVSFQGANQNVCTANSFGTTYAAPPTQFPHNTNPFPAPWQPPNYAVPYHVSLYGGCYPSRSITVAGSIPTTAKRFHINLNFTGGTAFHLNPRFDENAVVRNSYINYTWGPEERNLPSSKLPFSHGQNFVLWIVCETQCFKVMVNGQHMFNYNHRVPNLQQIDRLEVDGDVILQHVQV
ncbi:galectin-9 isoform X2 [Microcaecilia unicolor]|uniref:Galectin n=1 Tax=Microcaecilia unicolor TaxID=1415580 RepID=A0A6P7WFA1_9AMPH|nr:galectin-9-like isoform X2 [Microcaecilia unicolor]